jgi:hypothetical protein
MDLPPDKAKILRSYDSKKKWELICDQVSMSASEITRYCRPGDNECATSGLPMLDVISLSDYIRVVHSAHITWLSVSMGVTHMSDTQTQTQVATFPYHSILTLLLLI